MLQFLVPPQGFLQLLTFQQAPNHIVSSLSITVINTIPHNSAKLQSKDGFHPLTMNELPLLPPSYFYFLLPHLLPYFSPSFIPILYKGKKG